MAFNSKNESTGFKRIYGFCEVELAGVNPTKEQLSEWKGVTLEKDINYVTERDNVKTAIIDIWFKLTDIEENGIGKGEFIPMRFYVRNIVAKFEKSGKTVVIDKYGNSAIATDDDIENKRIPQYRTGLANIDVTYRKAFDGEREFKRFIQRFVYNKEKTEIILDMNKLFNDNFKELDALLKKSAGKKFIAQCYQIARNVTKEDGTETTYYNSRLWNEYIVPENSSIYYYTKLLSDANTFYGKQVEWNDVNKPNDKLQVVVTFNNGNKEYYYIGDDGIILLDLNKEVKQEPNSELPFTASPTVTIEDNNDLPF